MKIVQLLPSMSFGDAVSNDAAAIQQMIRESGMETALYSRHIDSRLPAGTVRHVKDMEPLADEDILLYHGSTGDPMNLRVPLLKGKKVMRYHNITPPHFFEEYSRRSRALTESGYWEMKTVAPDFSYAVADSDYNRQDMRRLGFRCPIDVCPVVIPFSDYDRDPDPEILERYSGDGWTNLLFVGRISPNKRQENVIRAFEHYHRNYNAKSRLFLVGSPVGMETYLVRLQKYVRSLRLEGRVIFTGQISFRAILAYYRLADVFVCMSEHEGFCVPIVEAMYFGKPIVALRAAAVPETLGNGGLLLDSSDPAVAAAAIDRLGRDAALRDRLAEEQKRKLLGFSYENVRERLMGCLETFMK